MPAPDNGLDHVLNTWRLSAPQPLTGGYQNQHWLVLTTAGTELVLRRYKEDHGPDLDYEFEVMRRLADRGLRVPRLVETPMEHDGTSWILMTRMPGAESPAPLAQEQRRRGRLLAEFHERSIDLRTMGQRQKFHLPQEWLNDEALFQQLRRYEAVRSQEGYVIRWHLELARERMADLDLSQAGTLVLHGDFVGRNLLFEGDRLSGILDFEATHLNYRSADFAMSWRGAYDEVVHGYEDVRLLTELDRQLLVPAFWSGLFFGVKERFAAMDDDALRREDFAWQLKMLGRRSPLFADLQDSRPHPPTQ